MTDFYNKGKLAKPNDVIYSTGKCLTTVHAEFDVVAADLTNGDIFILAQGLGTDNRIHRIMSPNASPALTAAVDNDIGFYREVDGSLVAVDVDIIVDSGDLSAALTTRDLLSLNSSLDRTKTIGELLGVTGEEIPAGGYILAMTMNTKSTADGVLDLDVVVEGGTTN